MTDETLNCLYVNRPRIVTESLSLAPQDVLCAMRYVVPDKPGVLPRSLFRAPRDEEPPPWAIREKSTLIESMLINFPIPPVVLAESFRKFDLTYLATTPGVYRVLDGWRRLDAVAAFIGGEFALTDLPRWPELNGRTYATLPTKIREAVISRRISATLLLCNTTTDEDAALIAALPAMAAERAHPPAVVW